MSAVHRLDGRGEPEKMHKSQIAHKSCNFEKINFFKEYLSVPEHEGVHALGRGLHDDTQHGAQQPVQHPPVNIGSSERRVLSSPSPKSQSPKSQSQDQRDLG